MWAVVLVVAVLLLLLIIISIVWNWIKIYFIRSEMPEGAKLVSAWTKIWGHRKKWIAQVDTIQWYNATQTATISRGWQLNRRFARRTGYDRVTKRQNPLKVRWWYCWLWWWWRRRRRRWRLCAMQYYVCEIKVLEKNILHPCSRDNLEHLVQQVLKEPINPFSILVT
jgi:hypothetical protein